MLEVDAAVTAAESTQGAGNGADRASDACRPSRRRRRYRRHGFYRLKATLRELGPRTIDKRTSLGKALAAWKAELEADLGGAPNLSMQERTLIDVLVRQKVLLDSLDAWVFVQPTLVNARKREVVRVVRDRQVIVDSIARLMGQLGLKRRAVDGGDASRALLEVQRLRETASADVSRAATAGDGPASPCAATGAHEAPTRPRATCV